MPFEIIYAIIVTYNPELPVLARQLNSLTSQVQRIILVDNSSDNKNLIDDLLDKYPTATSIYNPENYGLGRAQNIGIEKAHASGASHVVLFDQDSVPKQDCIENLMLARNELLSANIKVAAVGPLYFNERTNIIYPISQYFGPFIKRFVPKIKPTKASFIIASGCLINLEDLSEIGMMNEGFFIDYIDIEWCFRAKHNAYSIYVAPEAVMIHAIGDNSFAVAGREISNHSPLRRYYLCRNSILMIKNPVIPIGYKLREIIVNLVRLLTFLVFASDRKKYWKYSIRGFVDGFKDVSGICPHKI
ncbi:glycosyltransferase family 2 protein [Pedobacter aquatilis]|uniref:glycosyltransferase family 2 protein n=1 Tax=Pedobacter aquatilis TaxID=351343 RepID=UPI0025B2ABF7|nr:glycosyltransferase family 2 protein [Pedobacter aquatilis]MDN3587281.1 glycosyltransferase family 2 protein [Pedobacter aquatilis]